MILLMLDYDGTLTPIVDDPGKANLDRATKSLLRRLARREDIVLAIISGRALEDLKRRIGLDGVFYAGCQGLEMAGPGWSFVHPGLQSKRPLLKRLERRLRRELKEVRRDVVENKGAALNVHYRGLRPRERALVDGAVNRAFAAFRAGFELEKGRMTYEFKPAIGWDKGRAVERLLRLHERRRPHPIYIGDDRSDEPAFEFLKGRGLTLLVDNEERPLKTAAAVRLRSQRQVKQFLSALA